MTWKGSPTAIKSKVPGNGFKYESTYGPKIKAATQSKSKTVGFAKSK